jgi:hypothetical protein
MTCHRRYTDSYYCSDADNVRDDDDDDDDADCESC